MTPSTEPRANPRPIERHAQRPNTGLVRAIAIASLGLGLVACNILSEPRTYTVSADKLQAAAQKKWPDYAHIARDKGLNLTNPQVFLIPDKGRIAASFDAAMDIPVSGMQLRGTMKLSGVPAYHEGMNAIVLQQFAVDAFELNNVPRFLESMVAGYVQGVIGRQLGADIPIYNVDKDKLTYVGKTWLPRNLQVQSDGLAITLVPQ